MSRAYVACRLFQYLSGPLTSFNGMNGSLGNQKLSPRAGSSRMIASRSFFAFCVSSSLSSGGRTLLSATNGFGAASKAPVSTMFASASPASAVASSTAASMGGAASGSAEPIGSGPDELDPVGVADRAGGSACGALLEQAATKARHRTHAAQKNEDVFVAACAGVWGVGRRRRPEDPNVQTG